MGGVHDRIRYLLLQVRNTDDPMRGYNGSRQGLLMRKMAVNRSGAIAVVNSTFRRDHSSHIWLHRGRRAGR